MILEVSPSSLLTGEIAVPGSKSHTIRAIIAALLANNTSQIIAPLYSEDTLSALNAAKKLGAQVKELENKTLWEITGCQTNFAKQNEPINLGNSGTTLRIISAIATLGNEEITFDGDDSLRTRIMAGLLTSLSDLGATCSSNNNFAPITVKGPIKGGKTKVDGTTSQYLTALLMTLPLAKKDSILTLDFLNEADYVKITLDWLSRCGISIEYNPNMLEYHIKGNQEYHSFNRVIPADFSTAAFPLAAGLIAGKQLKIANLDFDDLQGDKKVFEYAQQMNGNITLNNKDVVVSKSNLVGGVFDLNRTPDALPIMAVLGCYAKGTTILSNVPQARFKECDRIACMTKELRKMGANIEELPDGLVIHGGNPLHGAEVESYNDHRIAMALSVAALGANGPTYIKDGQCCKVTYPAFVEDFQSIGVSMKESSIK